MESSLARRAGGSAQHMARPQRQIRAWPRSLVLPAATSAKARRLQNPPVTRPYVHLSHLSPLESCPPRSDEASRFFSVTSAFSGRHLPSDENRPNWKAVGLTCPQVLGG